MRTSASPGPGGSMVNSSSTPGSPGSRAMTPRATIEPLLLLPDDSATGLLLRSSHVAPRLTLGAIGLIDASSWNRYISSAPAHPAARRAPDSPLDAHPPIPYDLADRKSTRLNSSHANIS